MAKKPASKPPRPKSRFSDLVGPRAPATGASSRASGADRSLAHRSPQTSEEYARQRHGAGNNRPGAYLRSARAARMKRQLLRLVQRVFAGSDSQLYAPCWRPKSPGKIENSPDAGGHKRVKCLIAFALAIGRTLAGSDSFSLAGNVPGRAVAHDPAHLPQRIARHIALAIRVYHHGARRDLRSSRLAKDEELPGAQIPSGSIARLDDLW